VVIRPPFPYKMYFGSSHLPFKMSYTEQKRFCSATKLGTTNIFFVTATKNFAAATKRFVYFIYVCILF